MENEEGFLVAQGPEALAARRAPRSDNTKNDGMEDRRSEKSRRFRLGAGMEHGYKKNRGGIPRFARNDRDVLLMTFEGPSAVARL